jgi:hypothetical protein
VFRYGYIEAPLILVVSPTFSLKNITAGTHDAKMRRLYPVFRKNRPFGILRRFETKLFMVTMAGGPNRQNVEGELIE